MMSVRELESSLAFLKVNHSQFAEFIGYDVRQVRRWTSKTKPQRIPPSVEIIIRLMCRLHMSIDQATAIVDGTEKYNLWIARQPGGTIAVVSGDGTSSGSSG